MDTIEKVPGECVMLNEMYEKCTVVDGKVPRCQNLS